MERRAPCVGCLTMVSGMSGSDPKVTAGIAVSCRSRPGFIVHFVQTCAGFLVSNGKFADSRDFWKLT